MKDINIFFSIKILNFSVSDKYIFSHMLEFSARKNGERISRMQQPF